MADGKRVDSLMDQVWKFFTSIKLAIFIIIILAIASIIGTIIEQNQPLEKYRQIYTDGAIRLFESLNLFDMYHSWWFLLLLVLFTVNLSCCTIDRLPRAVKVVRNPKTTLDENLEKSLSHVDRWKKKGGLEGLAETYKAARGGASAKPLVTENSGTLHLYAEKGIISRFGVYVTHLSIIIIFIGAIIGNVFGFKGFANIVEGESVRTIPTRGPEHPRERPGGSPQEDRGERPAAVQGDLVLPVQLRRRGSSERHACGPHPGRRAGGKRLFGPRAEERNPRRQAG